jgi:hypothetical protein
MVYNDGYQMNVRQHFEERTASIFMLEEQAKHESSIKEAASSCLAHPEISTVDLCN